MKNSKLKFTISKVIAADFISIQENQNSYSFIYFKSSLGKTIPIKLILQTSITIFFLLIGVSSRCQQSGWSKFSSYPEGGTIIDITTDNSGKVYVLNQFSQVFYTTDNGNNWNIIPGTFSFWNAVEIEVDKISGKLFVGTSTEGIWYTSDLGITWNNEYFFTSGQGIHALIGQVGIKHGSGIVVASEPRFGAGNTYISMNNGNTWSQYLNNAPFGTANDLLFLQDGILLAGSIVGIYRSANNGANWTATNPLLQMKSVSSIVQSANGNIFAAVNYNYATQDTTGSGVYLSTDNGQSYNYFSSGITDNRINCLCYDETTSTIFATSPSGVFSSSNNGTTWSQINFNLVDKNINCIIEKISGEIFIGANQDGVSKLESSNWALKNHGLISVSITDMQLDGNDFFVSCAGSSGLFSENISNQWLHTGIGQLPAYNCNRITNNNIGDLYATFLSFNISDGVVTSIDNGNTWDNLGATIPVPSGINYALFDDIEFGSAPGELYVLARYSGYPITTFEEIFKSLDNGTTWTSILTADTTYAIQTIKDLDVTASGDLYITYEEASTIKVMYSTNQGVTFNFLSPAISGLPIQDLIIDKQDSIYVLAENVLFKKNGANWNALSNGGWPLNPSQHETSAYFDNDNSIYFSCADNGVYYSNTNGLSWQNSSSGIPNYTFGGITYKVYLKDFYFDATNKSFARTGAIEGNDLSVQGIFQFDTLSSTSISEVNSAESIFQYPNPSGNKIYLSKNINSECFITDLAGRIIWKQKLLNQNEIEIQNLESGTYLLCIGKNKVLKFNKN